MLGGFGSLVFRRPARASNPYATHIPVLVGLSRLLNVERVLELGCGEYSTRTFLDRSVFPHVKELHSIEDDPAWAAKVMTMIGADDRLKITRARGPAKDVLDGLVFRHYDVIFIDDSQTSEGRSKSIRAIAGRCDDRNVVVIHDFEVAEYRSAARALRHRWHRFTFSGLNPYTGTAWATGRLDKRALRRVDRVIRKHGSSIQPEDLQRWLDVLNRALGK